MAIPFIEATGPAQASAAVRNVSTTLPIFNIRLTGTPGNPAVAVTWDSSSAVAREQGVRILDFGGGTIGTEVRVNEGSLSHSQAFDLSNFLPGNYRAQVYFGSVDLGTNGNTFTSDFGIPFTWIPPGTPSFEMVRQIANTTWPLIVWNGLDVTTPVGGVAPQKWLVTAQANPTGPLQFEFAIDAAPGGGLAASGVGYGNAGIDLGAQHLAVCFPGGAPYVFQIQAISIVNGVTNAGPVQATFTFVP
jgi:hypothetical protein